MEHRAGTKTKIEKERKRERKKDKPTQIADKRTYLVRGATRHRDRRTDRYTDRDRVCVLDLEGRTEGERDNTLD